MTGGCRSITVHCSMSDYRQVEYINTAEPEVHACSGMLGIPKARLFVPVLRFAYHSVRASLAPVHQVSLKCCDAGSKAN